MECSIDDLRRMFSYDPETGDITRLVTVSWNAVAGSVAGHDSRSRNTSYRRLTINGRQVGCHRVAWALFYGEWPKDQIDHKDRNGLNNRIANLRESNQTLNQRNQRRNVNNKTGFRGVSWHKGRRGWQAAIYMSRKKIHLGVFKTIPEAAAARAAAEMKYWGHTSDN